MEDIEQDQVELASFVLACHVHMTPEGLTEFYNTCHGGDGKFCPTPGTRGPGGTGAGGSGNTVKISGKLVSKLPDKDGDMPAGTGTGKRGKKGHSLVDPHEDTKTIAGVKGYDKAGKPVPGTDAWLEAHGIAPKAFGSGRYVKYEANKDDPALNEAFRDYPQAQRFWRQRAEQDGQHGGYIMYKHEVPGSPYGPVAPQVRPNKAVVTNPAYKAFKEKVLANDLKRLETLKSTTPALLLKERKVQVKQAELNLERIKTATPAKIRAEAATNLAKAHDLVKTTKAGKNPVAILEAQQGLVTAKRQAIKDNNRANNWRPDKELYDAETAVSYAHQRVARVTADGKGALAAEIKSQESRIKRSENAVEKAAAKYVFSKGTSSARIDMNQDPRNVKNLTEGKGRIYFGMEGQIKADAILTAARKEDPTAAVVNVPSVTLWQEKGGAAGEIRWFAQGHAKGRQIILIPDADGVTNPNVMAQAKALATALRNFGAGDVVLAAPPLKKGTRKQIDHFNLPSGIDEGRKGVDDHLGAGRGTLGQLQFTKNTKIPSYDLSEYGKAAGGNGPKINKNSLKNTESALAAISGITGPEGSSRMTKKMLAQAAGLAPTSAKEARDRLEKLGIISVEHVFDEQALSRGKRIRNPKVSEDRVAELVRKGVIKEPRLDQPFTEVTIEESPVITLRDPRFRIKVEDVETGTLSQLGNWKQPKSYKGWTSPVTGKPDSTGLAAKVAQTGGPKKNPKPIVPVSAAPGRRLVRSKEGAARYGVPIGAPIPLFMDDGEEASGDVTSLTMEPGEMAPGVNDPGKVCPETEITSFYNSCHGAHDGKFCPAHGGKGGGGKISGHFGGGEKSGFQESTPGWPSRGGRKVTTVASAGHFGHVNVKGIKAKAVYEVKTSDGKTIRLYDTTGKAGKYKDSMLNNHARMAEMYPLRPPRDIAVVDHGTMKALSGSSRTNAIVDHGVPFTVFNSDRLGIDAKHFSKNWAMPSSKDGDTKNMDYVLTHEYGHQVDFARNVKGDTYQPNAVLRASKAKDMSNYGKTSDIESYAESFAEWNHSNGQTTNPTAVAMARSEHWYGSGGISASADMETEDMDTKPYVLLSFSMFNFAVTKEEESLTDDAAEDGDDVLGDLFSKKPLIRAVDDFEHGPKIVGDYKVQEPTAVEIAKAEKLWQDVQKELEEKK